MANDWEKLAAEYNNVGRSMILIAEIDCTNPESKQLCHQFKVTAYPTLMYGDVIELQEYKGSRDLNELRGVVQDYLTYQMCSVTYPQLCDLQKRQAIQELVHMGRSKLDKEIKKVEETQQMLERKRDNIVAKLRKKYDKAVEKKKQDEKAVEQDLALMRECLELKRS
jgi:Thioredoxin